MNKVASTISVKQRSMIRNAYGNELGDGEGLAASADSELTIKRLLDRLNGKLDRIKSQQNKLEEFLGE